MMTNLAILLIVVGVLLILMTVASPLIPFDTRVFGIPHQAGTGRRTANGAGQLVKRYGYTGLARIGNGFLNVGGLAALVFAAVVAISQVIASVDALDAGYGPSFLGGVCWDLFWLLGISSVVALIWMNMYPTVWVSDECLTISAFLVKRISISWYDVLGVRVGHGARGDTLVRAYHITPAHRIYALMSFNGLYPSFVIGRRIQDHDELLNEIRSRAEQAKSKPWGGPRH